MKDYHKMGKELIAMGEKLCAMSGESEEGESYAEESDEEEEGGMSQGNDAKKKMLMAMMSKKYSSKEA